MFTVGLTGGFASGKSTVSALFAELGVDIVDADLVAREVVEPPSAALEAIRARHGEAILTAEGGLDRPALRKLVFADQAERKWLEALLHPLIEQRIRRKLAACGGAYRMLVSPLLLETSQRGLIDRLLVVDVPRQVQLRRGLIRDHSQDPGGRATIEAIIDAQSSRERRLEAADDVIDNQGPAQALNARVGELHERYLQLAANHD